MENWITYIMECAICLALLYLPFGTLLRKETFFQYNRYALLAISVLSFILPLISIPEITAPLVENETISIQLTEINVLVSGKVLPASIHWKAILAIIYLSGAVACLLYKIYDLIRLTRFIPQGCLWTHQENGIHIHCHAHDIVPFSWMSHIVISEKDYKENGTTILLHEQAHIACRHSWDVLWLSLVEVLQWFNPFVWMLSKEMQDIHEYEADLTLLRKGVDAKNYQLLIIQKASGSNCYAFANSFNHSSLKKRISMMIKKKSNPWARAKYLYMLPVAAICMIACTQSPKSADKAEEATSVEQPKTEEAEVKYTPVEVEETKVEEQTFQVVEEMPEFPGGMGECMKWLSKNTKYPQSAQENGVQGRVIVTFVVTKEGDIINPVITKGVDPALDAEALRVIKSMPKWNPGKQRGKAVNVKFTLPIQYRLQ